MDKLSSSRRSSEDIEMGSANLGGGNDNNNEVMNVSPTDFIRPDQSLRHRPTSSSSSSVIRTETERLSHLNITDNGDEDEYYQKFKTRYDGCSLFIHAAALVFIVAFFTCTLTFPVLTDFELFGMAAWRWALMTLVMLFGRLVSRVIEPTPERCWVFWLFRCRLLLMLPFVLFVFVSASGWVRVFLFG